MGSYITQCFLWPFSLQLNVACTILCIQLVWLEGLYFQQECKLESAEPYHAKACSGPLPFLGGSGSFPMVVGGLVRFFLIRRDKQQMGKFGEILNKMFKRKTPQQTYL